MFQRGHKDVLKALQGDMGSSEYTPKLICVAFPRAMWTGHLFTQDRTNDRNKATIPLKCEPVSLTRLSYRGIGEGCLKEQWALKSLSKHHLLTAHRPSHGNCPYVLRGVRASWALSQHNINGLNLWKSLTGNQSCWAFKRVTAVDSTPVDGPCRCQARITSLQSQKMGMLPSMRKSLGGKWWGLKHPRQHEIC